MTQVFQSYVWSGDANVLFQLVQTISKVSLAESQPITLGGQPAQRYYRPPESPAKPDTGNPNALLALGWDRDGNYYSLACWLSGPLDEATADKIALSVSIQ